MTDNVTPTQADLIERLRSYRADDGRILTAIALSKEAAEAIATQAAEIARLRGVLIAANAHISRMQDMMVAYVTPGTYQEQTGGSSFATEGDPAQHFLFACDMIYMLDGPEQRALTASLTAALNPAP